MDAELEEYKQVIDLCDVFVIGFHLFPERLVVDARCNEDAGPMVRVAEPLASVQARYYWLGRERPGFGAPERFMFAPWQHSLRFFEESGLLARIRERIVTLDRSVAGACDDAFHELRRLERAGTIEAIRGEDRYRTLWPTSR